MKQMIVVETKDYGNGIFGGAISYYSKCNDCGKVFEEENSEQNVCSKCSDRANRK